MIWQSTQRKDGRKEQARLRGLRRLAWVGWFACVCFLCFGFLPLLAGLVDPVWAESSYRKYDLVFLFCVESGKGVGGTSRWLTDVRFSCVVCRLLILGDVLRICKLDKSVSNDRLFRSVHHILGMMGNRFS